MAKTGSAEQCSTLGDRFEHRLNVSGRSAYDVKHFAGCSLVFERLCEFLRPFCKFVGARLLRLEQPRVLDGDDGLIGKGLKQRDLLVIEQPSFRASESNHADSPAHMDKGHRKNSAIA